MCESISQLQSVFELRPLPPETLANRSHAVAEDVVSRSVISVLVDSDSWDGTLATGMLAVVPPAVARPTHFATSFSADETTANRRAWDDSLDALPVAGAPRFATGVPPNAAG